MELKELKKDYEKLEAAFKIIERPDFEQRKLYYEAKQFILRAAHTGAHGIYN